MDFGMAMSCASFTDFIRYSMYLSTYSNSLRLKLMGGNFSLRISLNRGQSAFAVSSNSGKGILIARAEISRHIGA